MLRSKTWLILIAGALVAVAAYVGYTSAPRASSVTGVNEDVSKNNTAGYTWQLTEASSTDGLPKTSVKIVLHGATYDAGTYTGTCSELKNSAWKLLPNEEAGVICWFAGGGIEIGVFYEGGKRIVKKGELDEGSAETPSVRGNMTMLFELR